MICLDAGVIIAWVTPHVLSAQAIRARADWQESGEILVAPAFLQVEVTSVLRNFVFRRKLTPQEGDEAFRNFIRMHIQYVESSMLVDRTWQVAREMNSPKAYDMVYLALSDIQSCPLWTADERFVNLVGSRRDSLRWLGEVAL